MGQVVGRRDGEAGTLILFDSINSAGNHDDLTELKHITELKHVAELKQFVDTSANRAGPNIANADYLTANDLTANHLPAHDDADHRSEWWRRRILRLRHEWESKWDWVG